MWSSGNSVVKVESNLSDVGIDRCLPKVLVNWDINMKMNYLHGMCEASVH